MSLKVVLQDGIKDCGICCLLSIIRYYGGEVSKEYLRKITNTNKDGVSAYNLIKAAHELGMNSYGLSGDIEKFESNNLPCIAHVNVNSSYQHFVVIYKIESNKITIMDPATGKKVLSISEFKLMSTNNYIVIKVKKALPKYNHKNVIIFMMRQFLKKYKTSIIILSFITLNLIFIDIIFSFNFKYLMKFSINYLNSTNILSISFCLFITSFLIFVFNFLQKRLLYKILFIFDKEITLKTFKQLLLLPYFYYKNRTVGEILSRFNDLVALKSYLIKFISFFISDYISLIIFIFILFNINKNLSILVFIYMIVCSFFLLFRCKKKKHLFKKVKLNEEIIQNYIVESISNVDTTKGSHLEKRFIDKFSIKYTNLLNNNYNYLNFLDYNHDFLNFIENIFILLIISIGCSLIIEKKFQIENMLIFITFFQYSLRNFNRIMSTLEEFPNFKICLDRVEELYTIIHENFRESYYYLSYKLIGNIKINNLSYQIDNRIIFNNVNIEIKKGEKVLLFGNSGSGKSTLVKMLVRYIEVPFSMISIDNIDINHYHLENLRKYISYVSSNEMLFNDTIYNNICLYKDVSYEKFFEVIKICKVDLIFGEDINNYNKIIEENGFLLSGGEKQRIILARALMRESSIYIFDEAFGQIDIELTNKILAEMFEYLKDKIVIVISHRKNSKKFFDRILKLSDGKIYEK